MSRPSTGHPTAGRRPRVLFLNTRSALGADVAVHLTLLQNFDPAQVEVHFATNRHSVDLAKTLAQVAGVPGLQTQVLDLGHEISGQGGGKLGKLRGVAKNAGAFVSLARLALYVRRHGIDIIHSTDRPRDALLATLLKRLTGCRNVLHLHIKWYPEIGRATTYALEACTTALAISDFTRRSLIEGGVPERKIATVHNATDPAIFDPATTDRGFLRKKFGLTATTPLIGIVARIMVYKGHLELIEAMAKVRQAIPNVRLVIVGTADTLAGADDYTEQVRRRVTELGLDENVLWAGWLDEMPQVMADLDVLAMPSWEEPFGLAFTEAMAMQKPVVGFDSGAFPEIIQDGVQGFLTPPKDSAALADALITLLCSPELRAAMGRRGRERVQEVFTPRRQADAMTEVYRRMLAGDFNSKE